MTEENPIIINIYYKNAYNNITKYLELHSPYQNCKKEDNIKSDLQKLKLSIKKFIDWYILDIGDGYYNYNDTIEYLNKFDYSNKIKVDMIIDSKSNIISWHKDGNKFYFYYTICNIKSNNKKEYHTLNYIFSNFDFNIIKV
jgi:hypothetical protein